jgi:hypothetical protein
MMALLFCLTAIPSHYGKEIDSPDIASVPGIRSGVSVFVGRLI